MAPGQLWSVTGRSGMKVSFVAGFGPIVRTRPPVAEWWQQVLGMETPKIAPDYYGTGPPRRRQGVARGHCTGR